MDGLGKETLILKSKELKIRSDFIRTEYVNYDSNFKNDLEKFFSGLKDREEHYEIMSSALSADPVLAIDYLRRAFLLSGDNKHQELAGDIFQTNEGRIDQQSKIYIRGFLST